MDADESHKESASAGHGSASHGKPASSLPRENRKFALLFHLSLSFVPSKKRANLSVLVCLIWGKEEKKKEKKEAKKETKKDLSSVFINIHYIFLAATKHVQTQHHARENPTIDGNSLKQSISFVALMVWFFQLLRAERNTSAVQFRFWTQEETDPYNQGEAPVKNITGY